MSEEERFLRPGEAGRLWHRTDTSPMPASHQHAELELNLVREGAAAYLLGERRYELRRGTLVWLFPAQDHILLEQSPGYEMWVGVFAPELVRQVCARGPSALLQEADPPGQFCRRLPEGEADWLHELFGRVAAGQADEPRFLAGMEYALLTAWAAWEGAEDVPAGSDVHPAVERAARLMRDEADPLTLEQMAAQVGLSAPRLSLLFKRQTGMALTQFRNRQRLERFLRLYGRGQRVSLLEAALEAGWGSYPQFHRVFTQLMGCSPAQYQRQFKTGAAPGRNGNRLTPAERPLSRP